MTTVLAPYHGQGFDRARAWATMPDDERRRRAMEACQSHDAGALWELTDAHLTLHGKAGATVSRHTRTTYRRGVAVFILAWRQENLLKPRRNAAALWLREMEGEGLKPSTINVRLAAARALYAALRWAGATDLDPLHDAHGAPDRVPRWEKRKPYEPYEVDQLLAHARGDDRALVLLGAHAGLRVSEMLALRWDDVDTRRRELVVTHGKGGKPRTVSIGTTLVAVLQDLAVTGEQTDYVLPYRSAFSAWRRLNLVCDRAGVPRRGVHSLRHSAGTRVVRETGSLEEAAHHLGHASIETTRVYAKWSNTRLKATVGEW